MAVRIDLSYVAYKDSPEASEVSRKASKNIWLMLFFGRLLSFSILLPMILNLITGDPFSIIIFLVGLGFLGLALYGQFIYPKKINKKIDDILTQNATIDQRVHDYYNQNEKKNK